MLRLPEFDYHRPSTLAEAAALLDGAGQEGATPIRVVAGGTDLYPNLKRRHQKASTVVSLMAIPGLSQVRSSDGAGDGSSGDLVIGSTALLADVAADARVRARFPALAKAIEQI